MVGDSRPAKTVKVTSAAELLRGLLSAASLLLPAAVACVA
jgi:hypothetical protein